MSDDAPTSVAGGHEASWSADPDRLVVDIYRALKGGNWRWARVKPTGPKDDPRPPIDVVAMLPDGRQANIRLLAAGPDRVRAQIRVGHFGDRAKEEKFLEHLRAEMAGPAGVTRDPYFSLPQETEPAAEPSD
ncbi:MAG: hypothetical protein R3336_04985 [Phycisphaeraceae bacterium]|nr:hypothetical protein [Phycisphaeraceae bacterium]